VLNPPRTAAFTAALFLLLATAAPAVAKDLPTITPCTPGSPITGCTFTPPPQPGFGWVLADDPEHTVGEWYSPTTTNHTSDWSQSNSVRHDGPGAYTVYVGHVTGGGGVAHVAAAWSSGRSRCKLVTSYPAGSGEYLVVRCDNLAGTPKDNAFTASFTNVRPTDHLFGYRSSAGGVVHAHNSESGAVTTERTGTGSYRVTFAGLGGLPGGTAQVTATGQSNSWCKVESWSPDELVSARHVLVRCFTPEGEPVDSEFNVTFVDRGSLVGVDTRESAITSMYTWITAEQQSQPAWSYPAVTIAVDRIAGYYTQILLPDLYAHRYAYVHVTATGPFPYSCATVSWSYNYVNVRCYTPAGVPVDAPFTVSLAVVQ
jgi:hypothetical protein